MHIRRLFTLALAVAAIASAPALVARQNNEQLSRRDQEQRSEQEQRDTQALVQMVEDVVAGTEPAPADIAVQWEAHHFMRAADGKTYIPFSLSLDAAQLAAPGTAFYVRVVRKSPDPAPADTNDDPNAEPAYPWDNIQFLDVNPDGRIARAMSLSAGEYEVLIALKEKGPLEPQRDDPPAKAGFLRRDLTVPDFSSTELSTSSLLVGPIEVIAAPLSPEEQQANPYTFGTMRVSPSVGANLSKGGELQVLFWVYGAQTTAGKPDLQIDYNFHQKTADGEQYFNKTAPQVLNASTLPAQFDTAAGHQLPGNLVVPLASFPVGDYRLEIKLTDNFSGKTLTQNLDFTVEA